MHQPEINYKTYQPGERLNYMVITPLTNGRVGYHFKQDTIESVHGGGFFGQFLSLEGKDYGLKTSLPTPAHYLLRRLAWGLGEFPSQFDEKTAQLDFLACNLISDVLPFVTGGKFYSPRSLGYTLLPTGYTQLIEKVQGRGPKFSPVNEFAAFRQAQEELTQAALALGLEHVGQIHPNNLFGMANLWFDDRKGCFVWLDTLAAFKHQPIFGVIPFAFHKEVHDAFYQPESPQVTYNRIHTKRFLAQIARFQDQFDLNTYQKILEQIQLYEDLSAASSIPTTKPQVSKLDLAVVTELAKDLPNKVIHKGSSIGELIRAIVDSKTRRDLVLKGLKKGEKLGFVSKEEVQLAEIELDDTSQSNSFRLRLAETLMAGFYVGSWVGINLLEATALTLNTFSEQELLSKGLMNVAIIGSGQLASIYARFLGTRFIGLTTGTDLRAAALAGIIPGAGNFLPFAVQALVNTGSKNEMAFHYSVREAVAKISSLHPAGGWGTQLEGEIYNRFGHWLENLAVIQKKTKNKIPAVNF